MVLAELGAKISGAIRTMTSKTVIDEESLDAMLKEIAHALLTADVNVKIVQKLRVNIKQSINLEEFAAGVNRRRMIQKVLFFQGETAGASLLFVVFRLFSMSSARWWTRE